MSGIAAGAVLAGGYIFVSMLVAFILVALRDGVKWLSSKGDHH